MGKNFKVGDPVRPNVKHLSTFGKSGMVTSTDENFVYVEFENLPGTYAFQSESLELIQEEPMAHPYLTPEKIFELVIAFTDAAESEGMLRSTAYRVAATILEREANPPPKVRVFTVTMKPEATRDGVTEALTSRAYYDDKLITVEEIPS